MKKRMRFRKQIFVASVLLALSAALTGCFKEEPLNAECDIEKAWVEVNNVDDMFYHETDAQVEVLYSSSTVIFNVKPEADLTSLSPRFAITDGATITPENGSTHDFSGAGVRYTVTSQDGKWKREYLVRFVKPYNIVTNEIKMDFEKFDLDPTFHRFYDWQSEDGTEGIYWTSGNGGFRLSKASAKPYDYPTSPLAEGYDGYGVQLITRDTGALGRGTNKPIAAGNLYLGTFDSKTALTNALAATHFGIRWNKQPVKITGYYKYSKGKEFIDKDFKIQERDDIGDIYSVLYRNHDKDGNEVMLYGDDVLTNPNIVAIARIKDMRYTDEWTYFELDYEYKEDIDYDLLENYGYNFTVVFSSSKDGATFEGAIGSRLCVDKVRVICKTREDIVEEDAE